MTKREEQMRHGGRDFDDYEFDAGCVSEVGAV